MKNLPYLNNRKTPQRIGRRLKQNKKTSIDTFLRGSKRKASTFRGYSLSEPFISERVECIYGGSDEDRTRYLLHAMEALFQVSYGPITAPNYYTLKDFLGNKIFLEYDYDVEKSRRDIIQEITLKRSNGFLRAIKANQNLEVKF